MTSIQGPETYSESAEGVMITGRRLIQELRTHGITGEDEIRECMTEVGHRREGVLDLYNAGDVLRFLGY